MNDLTQVAKALVKLAAEVGNKEDKSAILALANRVSDLELAGGGEIGRAHV